MRRLLFWWALVASSCAAQPVPARQLSLEERVDRLEIIVKQQCELRGGCYPDQYVYEMKGR